MPTNPSSSLHPFGRIDRDDDYFEFAVATPASGLECSLASVVFTERGPRRKELGAIPGSVWGEIAQRVVRELVDAMEEREREEKKTPSLREGLNQLSPMVGRELAVLLWAIAEEGGTRSVESILHGWRELAREERWWLYSKASMLGQQAGKGWRRALYVALSDGDPEVRVEEGDEETVKKKSPKRKVTYSTPSARKRPSTKKKAATARKTKPTASRVTKKSAAKPAKKKAVAKKKVAQKKTASQKAPTRKAPKKKATKKKTPVKKKATRPKTKKKTTKGRATNNSNSSNSRVAAHD